MKRISSAVIIFIFSSNLIFAQVKSETEKNVGRYKSLEKAMQEPEKVLSYDAHRSRNIPVSVSDFKNLHTLSLFLSKEDKFPDGIKELKNLKKFYILSDAKQDWQTIFCGLDSLESFTLYAPITNAEVAEINNCIRATHKSVGSWLPFIKPEVEKTKFSTIKEAMNSEALTKSLRLWNDVEDLSGMIEIKNLTAFYFVSTRKRDIDLTLLSGSTTATSASFFCDGKLIGLDVSRFPNLETLFISVPHDYKMIELPAGIEKLRAMKELALDNVRYSEEQVDRLKSLLPNAKISLNQIVVQNPEKK